MDNLYHSLFMAIRKKAVYHEGATRTTRVIRTLRYNWWPVSHSYARPLNSHTDSQATETDFLSILHTAYVGYYDTIKTRRQAYPHNTHLLTISLLLLYSKNLPK